MPEPTTQQEREAVLPCPFCSGLNIIHCGHHMFCYACGSEGPDADTQHESDAIEQWNRRSLPPTDAPRVRELQGWQPIRTAPRDGTAFFACLEASEIPHAMRFDDEGVLRLTWDGYIIADHDWPTHWMPIPEPPAALARHERGSK